MRIVVLFVLVLGLAALLSPGGPAEPKKPWLDDEIAYYALHAMSEVRAERERSVAWLEAHGGTEAIPPLIGLLRWIGDGRDRVTVALQKLTGEKIGDKWFDWMLWLQQHPEIEPYHGFGNYLALTFAFTDPEFMRFVHEGVAHEIRLEEIVWGGVRVDSILPLDNPKTIAAAEASYLNPDDLVFGVELNGETRAYPLRIAGWHEMINDAVGGVPVSLAYCTLCNAGILYDGRVPGWDKPFTFATSGLLFHTNKLMYDRFTDSLWQQFTGRPVVGPLTGSGVVLKMLPLVITEWSNWFARHPGTTVLSLDTGFTRDYAPGAAYRDYFASKDLMFPALTKDRRLPRKDLVFGLEAPGGAKAWPLSAFKGGKVINDRVGTLDVVLVGDAAGETVRAYDAKGRTFAAGPTPDLLRAGAEEWRVTEPALVGPNGKTLPRLPGHLAYWFAWAGYFPDIPLGRPSP